MLRNYLKIALRNLRKQMGYTFINVVGLGLGLAVCVLILLYVQDDLSYDRYHEHADRVHRVLLDGALNGQEFTTVSTSAPMARVLPQEYPEIEYATRVWDIGPVLFANDDQQFYEEHFYYVDSTVFDVFSYPLLQGDPKTALTEPNSLVLSESTARKYFGDEDPMGKVLRFEGSDDFTITGIAADVPPNTHLRWDVFGSIVSSERAESPVWISNSFYTYLRLREGADPTDLQAKFPDMIRKYVVPQIEQALGQSFEEVLASGLEWRYLLQPLTDIHLYSQGIDGGPGGDGDISYVYILSMIAAFVLLIACINFMNLATARSANRAKEVGLRKVLGSNRRQLIYQFLGESVFLALVAMLLALVVTVALLPLFNNMADKTLALGSDVVLGLVGLALGAGLLAGLYPAFVLSSFRPAAVLKGTLALGASGGRMRSMLVVAQFAISIALLVGTGVVFDQLRYMQTMRLGFDQEQVVVLRAETQEARDQFDTFRQELLQSPNVVQIAGASGIPGRFNNDTVFRPEGAANEQIYDMHVVSATSEYMETLGLNLVTGRSFSRDHPADVNSAYVINETAARLLGWTPEEAIGKAFTRVAAGENDEDLPGQIVGVVQDFHFDSMHEAISPLAIYLTPGYVYYLPIRIRPENVPETLAFIEEKYAAFQPTHPFQYTFLDEDFGRLFAEEEKLSRIYGAFTLFAIFIACLGLFGLASFVTQQRTKEIGVRKVLGASVPQIVVLLSKEFTKLVTLAFVLAAPVAYFAMDRWLQDFAYRVNVQWYVLALAGMAALLVAWGTVSYQSIRAAMTDPVKALRYE
ncbi:MAG TPA: ABC transporter permease [Rhodothermales bacterium]|nr:ABC transporter permease [Rhodothermales bacterium]